LPGIGPTNYFEALTDGEQLAMSSKMRQALISTDARTINRAIAAMHPLVVPIYGIVPEHAKNRYPGIEFVGTTLAGGHNLGAAYCRLLGPLGVLSRLYIGVVVIIGNDKLMDFSWMPNATGADPMTVAGEVPRIYLPNENSYYNTLLNDLSNGADIVHIVDIKDWTDIGELRQSYGNDVHVINDVGKLFIEPTKLDSMLGSHKILTANQHCYLVRKFYDDQYSCIYTLLRIKNEEGVSAELFDLQSLPMEVNVMVPMINTLGSTMGLSFKNLSVKLNRKMYETLMRRAMYTGTMDYDSLMETGLGMAMTRYNLADRTVPLITVDAEEVFAHVVLVKIMSSKLVNQVTDSISLATGDLTHGMWVLGQQCASMLIEIVLSKLHMRSDEVQYYTNKLISNSSNVIFNELATSFTGLVNKLKHTRTGFAIQLETLREQNQCKHTLRTTMQGTTPCICCGRYNVNSVCEDCDLTPVHPADHTCIDDCEHETIICDECQHPTCLNPCSWCTVSIAVQEQLEPGLEQPILEKVKKILANRTVKNTTVSTIKKQQEPVVITTTQDPNIPYTNSAGIVVYPPVKPAIMLDNDYHDHLCRCGKWYRHHHRVNSDLHPLFANDCPWHEGSTRTIKLLQVGEELIPLAESNLPTAQSVLTLNDTTLRAIIATYTNEALASTLFEGKLHDELKLEDYMMEGTYHFKIGDVVVDKLDTTYSDTLCATHVANNYSGPNNLDLVAALSRFTGFHSSNNIVEAGQRSKVNVGIMDGLECIISVVSAQQEVVWFVHSTAVGAQESHWHGATVKYLSLPTEPISRAIGLDIKAHLRFSETIIKGNSSWSWDNAICTATDRLRIEYLIGLYTERQVLLDYEVRLLGTYLNIKNHKHHAPAEGAFNFNLNTKLSVISSQWTQLNAETVTAWQNESIISYKDGEYEKELACCCDELLINLWKCLNVNEIHVEALKPKMMLLKGKVTNQDTVSNLQLTGNQLGLKSGDLIYVKISNGLMTLSVSGGANNAFTINSALATGTSCYTTTNYSVASIGKNLAAMQRTFDNLNNIEPIMRNSKVYIGAGGSGKSVTIAKRLIEEEHTWALTSTRPAYLNIKEILMKGLPELKIQPKPSAVDRLMSVEKSMSHPTPPSMKVLLVDEATLKRPVDISHWFDDSRLQLCVFGDVDQVPYTDMKSVSGVRPTTSLIDIALKYDTDPEIRQEQYRQANPLNAVLNELRTHKASFKGDPNRRTDYICKSSPMFNAEEVVDAIERREVRIDVIYCFYKTHMMKLTNELERRGLIGEKHLVKAVLRVHANQGGQ